MTGFFKLLIYFLIFYIIYKLILYIKMLNASMNASRKKYSNLNRQKNEQSKYRDIEDAHYIEVNDDPKKKTGN